MEQQPGGKAEVLAWIHEIIDKKDWSATELARRSNLAPSTLLRMMNDPKHKFTPSLRTLRKIAEGANVDIPENLVQLSGIDRSWQPATQQTSQHNAQGQAGTGLRGIGPAVGLGSLHYGTVALQRVSNLPSNLQPKVGREVTVPRPPQLEGDDTAFAFHVPNADMEPWIPAGTLMYATRQRDPKDGDIVLIVKEDGRAVVRMVETIDQAGLVLAKSHPDRGEERLAFDEIKDIAVGVICMRL